MAFDARLWRACGAGLAAVHAVAAAALRDLSELHKGRSDFAYLKYADDQVLQDIGLTRGELESAVREPRWRHLGALLSRWPDARRETRPTAAPDDPGIDAPLIDAPSIVPDAAAEPAVADGADAAGRAPAGPPH